MSQIQRESSEGIEVGPGFVLVVHQQGGAARGLAFLREVDELGDLRGGEERQPLRHRGDIKSMKNTLFFCRQLCERHHYLQGF